MIKGGANLVQQRPSFSADGKFLLVCSCSSIRVLSVTTGLLVTELEGHSDKVTSVVVVPRSLLTHAWTSSLDGTVRLWDFISGVQIRCVNVGMPIYSMTIPQIKKSATSKRHGLVAFLSVHRTKESPKADQKEEGGGVILQNLTTGTRFQGYLAKTTYPQNLIVSPSGGLVGMADSRKIWIWRIPETPIENANILVTLLHHGKNVEVVAFDPTDTVVACGDHTGRMLVWRNVGELTFSLKRLARHAHKNSNKEDLIHANGSKHGVRGQDDAESCTTYHWHAHAVRCLMFTTDGSYMLSGGTEAVLVIWQVDSGKREYLPRLGAPLLYITSSPDASLFAISCADNSIKLVNLGSRTVEKVIQGIKPIVPLSRNIEAFHHTRVAIEPEGGRLVLPTMNLTLQFYDAIHDRHVTEVQVAARNLVFGSSTSKQAMGTLTFVTHVTFSKDASTMVTADFRLPDEEMGAASCLKFWRKIVDRQNYSIGTIVDEPHSAEISALVYHPEEDMAVSCSTSGDFKTWVQTKDGYDTPVLAGWRCRSVGSYRQKRMIAAAFSPDGTLLAVAAEELVTLWNPISNGLISVLSPGPPLQPISLLCFLYKSKFLAMASYGDKPLLSIWNLETLSLWWAYHLKVEAMAADPSCSNFAVMAASHTKKIPDNHGKSSCDSVVSIFCGDHPSPLATWKVQDGAGGAVSFIRKNQACYKENDGNDLGDRIKQSCSDLVALTSVREFVVFDPISQQTPLKSSKAISKDAMLENGSSAFAAMYGHEQVPAKEKKESVTIAGIKDRKPWGDLLNAPSHVLPALSKIGYRVIESFLQKHGAQ